MTTTLLGITPEGASTAAVEERLYIWLYVPYEIFSVLLNTGLRIFLFILSWRAGELVLPPIEYAIIYFSLSNIIFISYLMWYFTVQFKLKSEFTVSDAKVNIITFPASTSAD